MAIWTHNNGQDRLISRRRGEALSTFVDWWAARPRLLFLLLAAAVAWFGCDGTRTCFWY